MDLEEIIKKYVPLTQHPSRKGWYPVVCKVCHDHGKKGPRAAFKFEDGSVGYNCFNNPSCNASYSVHQSEPLSKAMEKLLQSYGIPESEWEWINFEILKRQDNGTTSDNVKKTSFKIEPDEIQLPPFFVKMSDIDEDDMWRIIAEDYLINKRHIEPSSYPFYISYKSEAMPHSQKWYGRLIIPIFKDDKIIFYQGRDLTDKHIKKYLNPSNDRDLIMFGYDQIYKHTDQPLYVTEGFFDAYNIGGVAVFGNKMTEGMLFHLRRSRRPKVIIPDRHGDGYLLALQALKEGWAISTPDVGNCKDISDAVVRFGKLYTMKTIAENTHDDFAAEMNIRLYCEDYN